MVCVSTSGVNRLAGISLKDPVNISITETNQCKTTFATNEMKTEHKNIEKDSNSYSIPDQLQQFMVLIPSKLRLVTLSAFILGKFKVRIVFKCYDVLSVITIVIPMFSVDLLLSHGVRYSEQRLLVHYPVKS